MSGTSYKAAIVLLLAAAIGGALYLRGANRGSEEPAAQAAAITDTVPRAEDAEDSDGTGSLPRLVDLGADKCIPCKAMAPILEELKREYAGVFEVEFIDVWKKPEAAEPYNIQLIPTQIFFDSSGKELFRHKGFFAKADILAKWKELGIDTSRMAS